ncbi:MAG TPA: hypothetical protein VMH78_02210 [Thermoplasmata archaeon]|nr:hypothetical protein [Thermoplasmata archaeon]
MTPEAIGLTISLGLLAFALAFLAVRGAGQYRTTRSRPQLAWSSGLALASAAMAVETVVYAGFVTDVLLQAYIFLSAAIVGVLSLGAARVFRRPRLEQGYSWYTLVACAAVGVASFAVPVPAGMVQQGIIVGNPSLLLLVLSSMVTGPATIVLLASAVVGLRRARRWQTLLLIAGALVLGAGGTFYIASFPVLLYYAEFIGIVLLFFGIVSLPRVPVGVPVARVDAA